MYGLRESASDRSNLAYLSTSAEPVTLKVTVHPGDGGTPTVLREAETLPPFGWTQIGRVLADHPNKDDVIVLDNVSAHKNLRTKEFLENLGVTMLFLPPYSPDMNPIEECWSKVKETLRRVSARTITTLDQAVAAAADAVKPEDAAGWFAHAGWTI